jgi:hypothetical protein
MPYGLIFPIAVVWLTVRYGRLSEPSVRSKWIVGGLAAASFALSWYVSIYLAMVVQLGICFFVLLYMQVKTQGK